MTESVPTTVCRTILNTLLRPSRVLFSVNYVWATLKNVMSCITDYSPHRTMGIFDFDEPKFLGYSELFSESVEIVYCICFMANVARQRDSDSVVTILCNVSQT